MTIFGQSAGSMSVSIHILSPLSKGLFKNAILESGSIYTDKRFMTKSQALKSAKKYNQEMGCFNQSNWIKCLKQIHAKTANSYNFTFDHFFTTLKFLPIVGEAFYPVESFEAFKTGRFNSGINILAGVVANEGSVSVRKWFDEIYSDIANFHKNVKEYLNREFNVRKLKSEEIRKRVIDFYIDDEIDVNRIKYKTGQLYGDFVISCPTYYMQKDMMLWSGDSKIFMYKLTYRSKSNSPNSRAESEEWIGVSHSDDIEFVFGTPLLYPERYSQQDYQFALLIMNLWSNFAKTG